MRGVGFWESCLLWSEKLEKAGTVNFEKHPARKVGTSSRQCGPKVPGGFAFPGARNPRICSISQFGKIFPSIFPGFSRSFPREPPNRPRKQPQPSRILIWGKKSNYRCRIVLPKELNFHYRDRSLGMLAENLSCSYRFSLEFQLISTADTDFGLETNEFWK